MREKKTDSAHADFLLSWSFTSGFFDAHGCVFKTTRGAYYLIFSKTNKEVLEMIRDFISPDSNILSDDPIPLGRKKIYRLIISNYHDVIRIGLKMLPLSIVKKSQLSDCLMALKKRGYRYKQQRKQKPWTEEEKIILLLTLDEPRAEVAKYLKRTVGSVDVARFRIKREG